MACGRLGDDDIRVAAATKAVLALAEQRTGMTEGEDEREALLVPDTLIEADREGDCRVCP